MKLCTGRTALLYGHQPKDVATPLRKLPVPVYRNTSKPSLISWS